MGMNIKLENIKNVARNLINKLALKVFGGEKRKIKKIIKLNEINDIKTAMKKTTDTEHVAAVAKAFAYCKDVQAGKVTQK